MLYIDNIFCVCHQECSPFAQNIIRSSLSELGLPLNPKDSHCGMISPSLGFVISTKSRTITVSSTKKEEILDLIAVTLNQKINQKQLQKVAGKLLWISQIIPIGIAYASDVWYEGIAREKDPYSKRLASKPCNDALQWFETTLLQHSGIHYFDLTTPECPTIHAFSDSSHIGAAFHTDTIFSLWLWCPCCVNSINNINTLELATIAIGIAIGVGQQGRISNLEWFSDSGSSVFNVAREYSKDSRANALLRIIQTGVAVYQFAHFDLLWTPRDTIKQVDSLTRGCPKAFIQENPKHTYVEAGAIEHTLKVIHTGNHSPYHPPTIAFTEFHTFSSPGKSQDLPGDPHLTSLHSPITT
jgi:hypothetical protein